MFEPIGDDSALVREFLLHYFAQPESKIAKFGAYLQADFLTKTCAEAKLTMAHGHKEGKEQKAEPDRNWLSLLGSEANALRTRVDIEFAPQNKRRFEVRCCLEGPKHTHNFAKVKEPVELAVFVKNVPQLLVKVFKINTTAFYRSQKREVRVFPYLSVSARHSLATFLFAQNTQIDAAIDLDGLTAHEETVLVS